MNEKEKIIKELIRIRDGFTPDPYMTVEDDIAVIATALIYIIKELEKINKEQKKQADNIPIYPDASVDTNKIEFECLDIDTIDFKCPNCGNNLYRTQPICNKCGQYIRWG